MACLWTDMGCPSDSNRERPVSSLRSPAPLRPENGRRTHMEMRIHGEGHAGHPLAGEEASREPLKHAGHPMAAGPEPPAPVKGRVARAEHHDHQAMMIADFRRRFWVSLVFTIPVVLLAQDVQQLLGVRETLRFTGESFAAWALSSVVYFYGGYPFLRGFISEVRARTPG